MPALLDDAALLSIAAELARRAASAILEVRARGFATRRKADASPVTEADHAAEAIIVQGLRAACPYAVIAEEEIEAGHVHEPGDTYWLVDPLDGTREFAAGRDEYCVNIGLVRDGAPVLGAVAVPATGELFGGLLGRETVAWKRGPGGTERAIRARPPPPEGMHVMASRAYATDEKLRAFLRDRPVAAVTNIGSAVKMLRLAEGVADLYPRLGRTMEWDTAAPQAVLEAAGGSLCAMDGTPLRYGKPDWANPPFVCHGLRSHSPR